MIIFGSGLALWKLVFVGVFVALTLFALSILCYDDGKTEVVGDEVYVHVGNTYKLCAVLRAAGFLTVVYVAAIWVMLESSAYEPTVTEYTMVEDEQGYYLTSEKNETMVTVDVDGVKTVVPVTGSKTVELEYGKIPYLEVQTKTLFGICTEDYVIHLR